jgi:ATP-dependent exoDNAse (exonuclease V) beta subunit
LNYLKKACELDNQKAEEESVDPNIDERKLFYVALTRARKKVFISYSSRSEDGREQLPSQFISEIPDEFKIEENVEDFEYGLQKNQEDLLTNKKQDKEQLMTKEYASELFRRQGLSVSALNNYLQCPDIPIYLRNIE